MLLRQRPDPSSSSSLGCDRSTAYSDRSAREARHRTRWYARGGRAGGPGAPWWEERARRTQDGAPEAKTLAAPQGGLCRWPIERTSAIPRLGCPPAPLLPPAPIPRPALPVWGRALSRGGGRGGSAKRHSGSPAGCARGQVRAPHPGGSGPPRLGDP
eukprot:scaffold949_cov404-Prasinococcus_capsulatus_cf.AAC.3